MEAVKTPLIEWGVATLTPSGHTESGDRQMVAMLPNGILMAVVDGLGHGAEAAEAAQLAVRTLEMCAQESVISLVKRCHERLRGTRGAVMSLVSINALEGTMTWVGVGNVEGKLLRANPHISPQVEFLLLRGGVVGSQLPPLYAAILPIEAGDTLIFFTDGIRSGFVQGISPGKPPQQIADHILTHHSKGTDDALVLVARYLGAAP